MHYPKSIIKALISSLFLLLITSPIVLILLGLQDHRLVPPAQELQTQQLSQIQHWVIDNNPQRFSTAGTQQLKISAQEIKLLLDYATTAIPQLQPLAADIELSEGLAEIKGTLVLPHNPIGQYVNFTAAIAQMESRLYLRSLTIGYIAIPQYCISAFWQVARKYLQNDPDYIGIVEILNNVDDIRFDTDRVTLALNWQPSSLEQIQATARQLLISDAEKQRLIFYNQQIATIADSMPQGKKEISLNRFLRPLFKAALDNSSAGADPIAENQAIFISLAMYVSGQNIEPLVGEAGVSPRKLVLTIQGQFDLAQHFLTSAAITASAGAQFAEILSIGKEAYDSKVRHGFSFSDITANYAGATFATLATQNSQQAQWIQTQMINVSLETDYMPFVQRVHDAFNAEEFRKQYQNGNNLAYQKRIEQIEKVIAACPLYQAIWAKGREIS